LAHGGKSFETTVANGYRREGWTTIRAYASLGKWDLMCFRKAAIGISQPSCTEVLAVQVKGKESDPFTDEEKLELKQWAEGFGGRAVYAYGKRMPLKKKIPGSRQRLQKNRTVIREFL
jgi:Holliday junction resolvase